LNLKLWSKQHNKIDLLHLIVAPQLNGGWRHTYSIKIRQAGCANEQSMYSLMSMVGMTAAQWQKTHLIILRSPVQIEPAAARLQLKQRRNKFYLLDNNSDNTFKLKYLICNLKLSIVVNFETFNLQFLSLQPSLSSLVFLI
jgi:hypothetical protein